MALIQAIEHHDRVTGLDKLGGGNAADVAGTAGDEYFHINLFPCCVAEKRSARFRQASSAQFSSVCITFYYSSKRSIRHAA
jgi:hypothetical protein